MFLIVLLLVTAVDLLLCDRKRDCRRPQTDERLGYCEGESRSEIPGPFSVVDNRFTVIITNASNKVLESVTDCS